MKALSIILAAHAEAFVWSFTNVYPDSPLTPPLFPWGEEVAWLPLSAGEIVAGVEVRVRVDPPPPPPPPPGRMVAEADLEPSQIQDLADQMPAITKAAVGLGLKIHVRVEVGEKAPPPTEAVKKINQALREVAEEMRLV